MRGPSYTNEEKKVLAKVVAKKGLTLKQRVEAFFAECASCNRTPDAVMQRIRKMVLELEGPAKSVKKMAASKVESAVEAKAKPAKRGRPSARAAAPRVNGNGASVNGSAPVVNSLPLDDATVKVGKVTITGPFQDVARLLQQAS